jgi:hypothetical protein
MSQDVCNLCATSRACRQCCGAGSYLAPDPTSTTGAHTCVKCDAAVMACDEGGLQLESIALRSGYWRQSLSSDNIKECFNEDACSGGAPATASVTGSSYCADGYQVGNEDRKLPQQLAMHTQYVHIWHLWLHTSCVRKLSIIPLTLFEHLADPCPRWHARYRDDGCWHLIASPSHHRGHVSC